MKTTTTPDNHGLKVRSAIDVSPNGPDMGALFELARRHGSHFVETTRQLCRDGKLTWEKVDLRDLFIKTIDIPCEVQVDMGVPGMGTRTLTTSAFPVLAGSMTSELLERTDPAAPPVWSKLVTVKPTNKETTHLVRIVNADTSHIGGNKRKDGDPYPLMTSSEERVQVDTVDDGRRLAINAKVIETNDKSGFLEQVNALRDWANERRDVITLYRVYDLYGSGASPAKPYVYRPDGSGTALYTTSTTALKRAPGSTRKTNNVIQDVTSLQNLIDIMVQMKNENGHRVSALDELELLAPHALSSVLHTLTTSEKIPGQENAQNPFGPGGLYKIAVISSPKIDSFTTSSAILARKFAKQFVMVSRLDMEYVQMAASAQDFLRTRLAWEGRIADEFEVGARDHNRCVQSLASTTPPTGPTLGS